MPDDGFISPEQTPWFVRRLHEFVSALLYDEDAARRWIGLFFTALGGTVLSGGNIPGTEIVVPFVGDWIPTSLGLPTIGIGGWLLGKSTATKKEL